MELVKPHYKKLKANITGPVYTANTANTANAPYTANTTNAPYTANTPYNNYIYYNKPTYTPEPVYSKENENKPKLWCQSGVKDLTKEHEHQRRKYYEKSTPEEINSRSYISPIYDKHLYFGADYIVLCRFQMNYIVNYSQSETKPNIDLESLKRFMNTYATEVILRTPNNQIYSTKTGFTKISEYIIRGLVNIALGFGDHKSVSTNQKIKNVCQNPPYSLACLLINPDDDYHRQHLNGSQYKVYNMLCAKSYYTQPAAKQELGEERGFYVMQMGQTFYLISHEICIKELSTNSAVLPQEMETPPQNILSFDNIAAMYTGLTKGYKIVGSEKQGQNLETTKEVLYNVTWSKFYLTEITKETSVDIVSNIVSFRTFVKPVRDEGYYINHTHLTPRQKLIFDIVTMFCDGLSVGFELKNIL